MSSAYYACCILKIIFLLKQIVMNPDLNSPKQSDMCLYCLPYRPQKCIKSKNVVDSKKRFKLGW